MFFFWVEHHADLQSIPPKRRYLPTCSHGVTTQKINIDIFTTARTSNLKTVSFFGQYIFLECTVMDVTNIYMLNEIYKIIFQQIIS
jgi:hypothetical protein